MTYTKTSPFLRFSPFWAFFRQKGDNCSPQAIKRGREGKETPSAHPERLQRKAVGGRRAAAPRSRLARPCVAFFCADGREWAANNRALVPPGLRRRRPPWPPRRRPWAWSCRCWAWGGGGATPAPAGRLCAVRLGGLAAGRALPCVLATGWRVAFAPFRRARGLPPGACLADGRSACRGVGQSWAFCFASGRSPSPAAPTGRSPLPLVVLACGSHPSGNFSGGRGTTSRVLWPLAKVGCARGARPAVAAVSAVCLPAFGRARSACRAVCAVRALRRASPPSSGGQVRALKGFSILQREHRGTGTRLRRSDRRLTAAIKPESRRIGRRG